MKMPPSPPLRVLGPLLEHKEYAHVGADPYYFAPGLAGLHSPLALPDLGRAVAFLREAVGGHKVIAVVGDRDVDGVSSAALVAHFLREIHEEHSGRLIVRVSSQGDDYGLAGGFLEDLQQSGADLFLILDMGTSHGPEIATLTGRGARAIVLDHHQILGREPVGPNVAFVNPLRDGARFEHGGKIATVGLAFKLLCGYALSFTAEWKKLQFFQEPSAPMGPLFRAGAHLGDFADPDSARVFGQGLEGGADLSFEAISVAEGAAHAGLSLPHFVQALADPRRLGQHLFAEIIQKRPKLGAFLQKAADVAAIGLIADLVPMVGENRTIVRLGMGLVSPAASGYAGRIVRSLRPGLAALFKRMNVSTERFFSRDLAWSISPALNAAGRMGRTDLALHLLTSRDSEEARRLAADLVGLNEERRERTKRNEALARTAVGTPKGSLVFCYHPDLEPGVSGIVAARLAEAHRRPCVFVNPDGPHARGSARAFSNENVLELIAGAEDLLIQFGGHREAAGFSVAFQNIEALRIRLDSVARKLWKQQSGPREAPAHHISLRPSDLDFRLLEELERMEPFGPGNPEPVLQLDPVRIRDVQPLGSDGRHVRFQIEGAPPGLEALLWNQAAAFAPMAGQTLRLIGGLEYSHFRGRGRLRFRVEWFDALENPMDLKGGRAGAAGVAGAR